MRRRLRKKKTTPYVRRIHRGDYCDWTRGQIQLMFYLNMINCGEYRKAFVLVQHGWPRRTMFVEKSKAEILSQIVKIRAGKMSYKQWQRHVARISRDIDLNRRRR